MYSGTLTIDKGNESVTYEYECSEVDILHSATYLLEICDNPEVLIRQLEDQGLIQLTNLYI